MVSGVPVTQPTGDAKGEKILVFLRCFLGHTPGQDFFTPAALGHFSGRTSFLVLPPHPHPEGARPTGTLLSINKPNLFPFDPPTPGWQLLPTVATSQILECSCTKSTILYIKLPIKEINVAVALAPAGHTNYFLYLSVIPPTPLGAGVRGGDPNTPLRDVERIRKNKVRDGPIHSRLLETTLPYQHTFALNSTILQETPLLSAQTHLLPPQNFCSLTFRELLSSDHF